MDPKTALLNAERAVLERKNAEKDIIEAEEDSEEADTFSYNGGGSNLVNIQPKGKLKKLAPILIFVVIIVLAVSIFFGSSSLLAGHFNANTIEAFDSLYPATEQAIETEVAVALENGSLPSQLAEAFTENGLEIGYFGTNGDFIAGLRPNLDTSIALASSTDSESVTDRSLVIRYRDSFITFANVKDYLSSDIEFYSDFRDSVYGRAAIQFTDSANQFYADFANNTRDPFKGYTSTGDNSVDTEAFHEAYRKIFGSNANSTLNTAVEISHNFENRIESNVYTQNAQTYPGCKGGAEAYSCNGDSNWNKVYGIYDGLERMCDETVTSGEICYDWKVISTNPVAYGWVLKEGFTIVDTPELAASKYGALHGTSVIKGSDNESYYANVLNISASAASGSGSYLSNALNMSYSESDNSYDSDYKTAAIISQAVSNNETMNGMEIYLTYESCINKMMAGHGSECPINQMLNELTTSYETANASGNPVTRSALQEPGLAAVLTDTYSSNLASEAHDSSVDRVIENATIAFMELTGTRLASSTDVQSVSSVAEALKMGTMNNTKTETGSFIADFGCYFIGKIEKIQSKATGGVISAITPSISQSVLFGKADEVKGEALGAMLAMGGSSLGNKLASYIGGGTTSDASGIVAYQQTIDSVLARDAAADRLTKSPFDITSKNTFLGSIAHKFASLSLSSDGLLDILSGVIPGASAAGSGDSYRTTYGNNCAVNDADYGAEADIYCVSTISFDMNTINSAMSDPEFEAFLEKNTDLADDGTRTPVVNSDLALFLTYNNGRQSNFGTRNNNIYNELAGSSDSKESIANIAPEAGNSPGILKKFFSNIKSGLKKLVNKIAGIFSGSHNTDGAKNVSNEQDTIAKLDAQGSTERVERISTGSEFRQNGDYWDTYKYAQAYSIYNLAAEIMGLYSEENTNTTSLNEYFQSGGGSNPATTYTFATTSTPEDETDIEYLSRISGLTLDEARYALDFTTVATYLANFDYDSVYVFGASEFSSALKISIETSDSGPEVAVIPFVATTNKRREATYVA